MNDHAPCPSPIDGKPPSTPAQSLSSGDEQMEELHSTPLSSSPPSEYSSIDVKLDLSDLNTHVEELQLVELFEENITAKALSTARGALNSLPNAFPEYVPQDVDHDGSYVLREAEFWTCGFFPGTLYLLLERLIKFPQAMNLAGDIDIRRLRSQLMALCRTWAEPLHGMASRTDTHDIGFIVMPALRLDWELFGNTQSLESIICAANSLASRYVSSARAIRSWDLVRKKDFEIIDQHDNMIVIIDSLCNLDLLYYASYHVQDPALADMATSHADTLLHSHLRAEQQPKHVEQNRFCGQWYSTCHVANIDPKSGALKQRFTAQGYAHESTWARGQAWGILGYAQTYLWTKSRRFLQAACGLAEYFIHRLESMPLSVQEGRWVPLWDFDAPLDSETKPLRDSSAGVIAANGLLVLAQALGALEEHKLSARYRSLALSMMQNMLSFSTAPEKAKLVNGPFQQIGVEDVVPGKRFEGMLKFGTANNNAQARKRYANHGLVYGDYYLVEFGNRMLRMGLDSGRYCKP